MTANTIAGIIFWLMVLGFFVMVAWVLVSLLSMSLGTALLVVGVFGLGFATGRM